MLNSSIVSYRIVSWAGRGNIISMRHTFLVVTVKMVKIGIHYGSHRKIRTGVSLFGPLCILLLTLVCNQWTPLFMFWCLYQHSTPQVSPRKLSGFFRANFNLHESVRPRVACTIQCDYDTWIKSLFSVQTTWRSQFDFALATSRMRNSLALHCLRNVI